MSNIPKRLEILASTLYKADSDYIYDPDHVNRPHDGKTYYRTPKGWSTIPQDGGRKTSPKESLSEIKSLIDEQVTLPKGRSVMDMSAIDRDLVRQLDKRTVKKLTDYQHTPTEVLTSIHKVYEGDYYGENSDVLTGVARHPNISTDVLKSLLKEQDFKVRQAAKDSLDKRQAAELNKYDVSQLLWTKTLDELRSISKNRYISPEILDRLSKESGDPEILKNIASNPGIRKR